MKLIEFSVGNSILGVNPSAISYLSEYKTGEKVTHTNIHFMGSGEKASVQVNGTVKDVLEKINKAHV